MAHSKFSSWNSLNTQTMSRSHGSRFESGCSSSLSSPVCVSCPCPDTFFAELEFTGYPVAFAMATGVFQANEGRSWTRSFNMAAMRYLLRQEWDIRMFRACLGLTTPEAYEQWARQEKQEVFTDILPEDAKLHWFGPRRDGPEGRVLLFFYGASLASAPHPRAFADWPPTLLTCRRWLQPASASRLSSVHRRFKKGHICRLGRC